MTMTAKLYKLRMAANKATINHAKTINPYYETEKIMNASVKAYNEAMEKEGLCPSCQKERIDHSEPLEIEGAFCTCVWFA